MYATNMNVSWNNDNLIKLAKVALLLIAFLVTVSWEDAAKDQHSRMHGDDDAGGAGCSMHIDYLNPK